MAWCLLKSMDVPATFWGDVVKTAVYLLNRSPTRSVDEQTPYEAWHKKKPAVHHLCTFRCVAHVKRVGPGIDKLADRSTPMIFLGYAEGAKAYRVFDPATNKMHVTRDVVFEERRKWNWMPVPGAEARPSDEHLVVVYGDEEIVDLQTPPTTADGTPSPPSMPAGSPIASTSSPGTPVSEEDGWAT